ncbi:MAG: hypothetical protein JXA01_04100, partial [Dehalococcoidia bacterium]|nr:hypothetical protein [Dehalococcoidia bacterium]
QLMPANFEVTSLQVDPPEANEGQEITITATVINSGGISGNFDEPLIINGTQLNTRLTTIQPGLTKTLTYTVIKNKPGKYSVSLHNAAAEFIVIDLVKREMELKYDSDQSRTALWAGYNGGFLIEFTPTTVPYCIDKVRICGGIYGMGWEGKTFNLYILDSDMKSILYEQTYAIAKFPVLSAFPFQQPAWVDFEISPINLSGKFYVYLYTSMAQHKGIQIGVDDSIFNEHSYLAQGKPPHIAIVSLGNIYPLTIWYADSTKVNWMIRTAGTVFTPAK